MIIFHWIFSLVVTIGMLSMQSDVGVNEISNGYFAVLHGGMGERTYETYVYRTDDGYQYVNVTSTTVSWGSPQWESKVDKRGRAATREKIVEIAKNHGAGNYVTYPHDRKNTHSIEEFIKGVPVPSEKYLIGLDLGGASWGGFYDCIGAGVTICTNHELLITMPTKVENYTATETEVIATLKLTEKQYQNIEKAVNREELFMLDPMSDEGVCDGYSLYLTIYDENDVPLKNCGGYMPANQYLMDMYRTICDNLPVDEILEIRREQIEKLKN